MPDIVIHDTLDETLPLYGNVWADLRSVFDIPHVYKYGGKQESGFVQLQPEHSFYGKIVCVMAPPEANQYGIIPIKLQEYEPKRDCVYVFGPDNSQRGWQEKFEGLNTDYITIMTPGNTELYSFLAASMVLLHHRTYMSLEDGRNRS